MRKIVTCEVAPLFELFCFVGGGVLWLLVVVMMASTWTPWRERERPCVELAIFWCCVLPDVWPVKLRFCVPVLPGEDTVIVPLQ